MIKRQKFTPVLSKKRIRKLSREQSSHKDTGGHRREFLIGGCLEISSDKFEGRYFRTSSDSKESFIKNKCFSLKHGECYGSYHLENVSRASKRGSSCDMTLTPSKDQISSSRLNFHEFNTSFHGQKGDRYCDAKEIKCSSSVSPFKVFRVVQLSRCILSVFLLLVLLAKCSLADFCLPKCSCTFVPSPTLAADKWASLMPSASPTLLASLIYPQSNYPKKYSNLTGLWPKLVNSTAVDLLSPDNTDFNSENQTTSKNKRDVRREDSVDYNANVSENIIEIHDPILSPDFDKDYQSRHKPPAEGKQAKVYPEYIQSLMNDPYVRRLLLNRKRKQDHVDRTSPRIPDREDSSLSNKDGSVPEVIQEQIPDFYRGIITPHKNLREEIRWIGNETSETHPKKFEEDEDSRAFTTKKRVAVLCERNRFVSVPEEEETSRNFSLTDIISLWVFQSHLLAIWHFY